MEDSKVTLEAGVEWLQQANRDRARLVFTGKKGTWCSTRVRRRISSMCKSALGVRPPRGRVGLPRSSRNTTMRV